MTVLKYKFLMSFSTDMKQLGHANRQNLVEEVLRLMAREKHNQEVLPLPRLHLYLYWLILMPSTSLPPLIRFLFNSMPCQWIRKPISDFFGGILKTCIK